MLGKLPRNEIIIKSGRAIEKNKGGGKRDATQRECCADADRERKFIYYIIVKQARYIFGRDWISFWRLCRARWESPDIGAHERLFSCFVADDYYWCSLRKWKVSWRSTRAEHDLIVRHKIKSARIRHPSGALTEIRENITLYMRARGLYYCCWFVYASGREYGREHDKYNSLRLWQ